MKDTINYGQTAQITTKEELIYRLAKKLAEAEGKKAYLESKIDRNSAYLGDPKAELAHAIAEAEIYRKALNNLK